MSAGALGARARAVLDAMAAAGPDTLAKSGDDMGRLKGYRRDARADLWLIGPDTGFEIHLLLRARDTNAAFVLMKDMVGAIWPEARS